MTYTISEVAEKMGVSVHTLRFYDKEGLLPFVDRVNGRRVFKDSDFSWLRILNCLKNTGMPLKEIRRYIELCQTGDESLKERQEIILRQKESLEEQIRFLQYNLKELDYKVWYYETAVAAGTERIHEGRPCNPTMEPDLVLEKEEEVNQ
ncbi:MAG: MerR family transcriptional regulator [Fusicatenibacter sp.]|nr:MerR family transcriptional regulator [Fusicatenibacter sp.]